MPTRPKNIAVHNNIFDRSDNSGVIPNESPTVNNADADSNSNGFNGKSGSSPTIIIEYIPYEIIEIATTAFARLIEPTDTVRPNAVTLSLPVIIALKLSNIAANVLTFIPPAVDCDAPPIHISIIIIRIVILVNDTGFNEVNPELRGTNELNTDCMIFSYNVIPAKVLLYSNIKNNAELDIIIINVVLKTIFVFMS